MNDRTMTYITARLTEHMEEVLRKMSYAQQAAEQDARYLSEGRLTSMHVRQANPVAELIEALSTWKTDWRLLTQIIWFETDEVQYESLLATVKESVSPKLQALLATVNDKQWWA